LFNLQLYLLFVDRTSERHAGADGETPNGTPLAGIGRIIYALRHERYRFKRAGNAPGRDAPAGFIGGADPALPEPSGSALGDALSAIAAAAHAAITRYGFTAADLWPLLGRFGLARYLAPAPGWWFSRQPGQLLLSVVGPDRLEAVCDRGACSCFAGAQAMTAETEARSLVEAGIARAGINRFASRRKDTPAG
jgi:hypothetical protein